MAALLYKLQVRIPRSIKVEGRTLSREEFFEWAWRTLQNRGLQGIHEGTLLCEEAAERGLETESWTVDSAEAPRERDWVEGQDDVEAELYFQDQKSAQNAARLLEKETSITGIVYQEQKNEDWDAQWRASFLGSPEGVKIPPFWRILPPWPLESAPPASIGADEKVLKINPGAGFGTGTHETTQLCMQAIAEHWKYLPPAPHALDFGCGSGILSIAVAMLGGTADGVEIDPLAIDNANDNAALNEIQSRVKFTQYLDANASPYPLVIANILKPVLLEFAEELTKRLTKSGVLVLSGLIEKDVADIVTRYSALLGGAKPVHYAKNEWRALAFRR